MPDNTGHSFVETNGVRLHVVTAGAPDGEPVLLLHGFPEFWYGWRHQIPALAQAGFRVIVPDQRGYNLSSVPETVLAYRSEELVRDVIGLLDHFGIEKANLAGHDWGAAVAWKVAMTFPDRVRRLAILNVPHPAVMLAAVRRSPRQMLRSWYIAFFQIPGPADRLLKWNDFMGAARLLRTSGKGTTFSDHEIAEYKKAWATSGGLTGMIDWYRAIFRDRSQPASDVRVRAPTLVLWGKRDVALGQELARRSIELCDNGRLVFFDRASHWVQHDEAEGVNRELLEFFR